VPPPPTPQHGEGGEGGGGSKGWPRQTRAGDALGGHDALAEQGHGG